MKSYADIIVRPLITEKSMDTVSEKRYSFEVAKNATKAEIAAAVEAMFSALSAKVAGGEMVVVDSIVANEYKTKTMVAMLAALGAAKKSLIVLPEVNDQVIKSCANIEGVKTTQWNTLNVYDILNCDTIIVAKDAVAKIEEVYAR